MNEKTKALLDGLTEERGIDWRALEEENHPVHVAKGLDAIRRWLGIPGTTGGLRPSDELLRVLLGYGREGCLKILASFCEETMRTDQEAAATLGALATVARQAKGMRLIGWSIDDVKPEAARGKPRLLVELEPSLDERLRTVSAARGESLRTFVEEALRERLAKLAGRPRRATSRAGATVQ